MRSSGGNRICSTCINCLKESALPAKAVMFDTPLSTAATSISATSATGAPMTWGWTLVATANGKCIVRRQRVFNTVNVEDQGAAEDGRWRSPTQ